MAVTAPTYVLEESLSSQKLWKNTAGNRPPQPVEERAFFEKMWAQNFARSQRLKLAEINLEKHGNLNGIFGTNDLDIIVPELELLLCVVILNK